MIYTIYEPNYDPYQNMTRDKELLDLSKKYDAAIVRIYSWKTPTISLGRLQKEHNLLSLELVQDRHIPVITRPTGGRAVLHANELTYAFAFHSGLASTYGKSVDDTYCIISKVLIEGLKAMNVDASLAQQKYDRSQAKTEQKLPCFLSTVPHEIEVQGKKLIGSAQLRHPKGVLQHGSIPLDDTFMDIVEYEKGDKETKKRRRELLQEKSISLAGALNGTPTFDEVAQSLIRAFSSWEKATPCPTL